MNKIRRNESGFSAFEGLLVLVIIILIGTVGYMVYRNHHRSTTNTVKATSISNSKVNPYAGWKTYTLPIEKLSLMYPSSWTINQSNTGNISATQEDVEFDNNDGFAFAINDGQANGGDYNPEAPTGAVSVKFLNQSDYFVPEYGSGSGGQGTSDGSIGSAYLQTNTNSTAGPNQGWPWPTDKNAVGPADEAVVPGAPTNYFVISAIFNTQLSLKQFPTNADVKNAELVIASMHY